MKIFNKILIFLSLIFIDKVGFTQFKPTYEDAGSWNTLGINYKLNKKVSFFLSQEIRFKENYSRLNLLYTDFGMEYAFNKYFKSSLSYRTINKFEDENRFSFRNRLTLDLVAKYKPAKLSISYRQRFQLEYRDFFSSSNGQIPEWTTRSRAEMAYAVTKRISSYFSYELFYQFYSIYAPTANKQWFRRRYQFGIDYSLNKNNKLGIYYMIQRVFNIPSNENLYITGLEYSFSINNKSIKKKKKKSTKK